MPGAWSRHLTAAAITVGSVVCAVLIRTLIDSYLNEPLKYGMLYVAVIVTVLHCGLRWGFASIALAVLAVAYLLPPLGQPRVDQQADVDSLVLFLLTAGIIVWMADRARKHRRLAEQVARERQELWLREQAAREEAERLNGMKDRFLAAVTHELRTPLQSILGWAEILQESAATPEDIAAAAAAIKRSAQAQSQLVGDLLELCRIGMGKLQLDVRPMPLAETVQEAVQTILPAARAKNVQINLDCTSLGPVLGDASRLQQVAWNLLSNAIKFTPQGGVINVAVRQDGDAVTMTVADSGAGISPDLLPHVFDRFRQGAGERRHEGLGLGLAIVKELVELHGGKVEAQSDGTGCGAEFTITLPKYRPMAVDEGKLDSEPVNRSDLRGKQVLVIDDDAAVRQSLQAVLAAYGAEVLTAGSAAEALELLHVYTPDVVTCDLDMPELDGMTFARDIYPQIDADAKPAPIVALTGCMSDADRVKVLSRGFDDQLLKPVRPSRLAATLAELIARRGQDGRSTPCNELGTRRPR